MKIIENVSFLSHIRKQIKPTDEIRTLVMVLKMKKNKKKKKKMMMMVIKMMMVVVMLVLNRLVGLFSTLAQVDTWFFVVFTILSLFLSIFFQFCHKRPINNIDSEIIV